jgi:hypothetical protein
VDNNYLDLGMSKSGFIHTLPSGRLSRTPVAVQMEWGGGRPRRIRRARIRIPLRRVVSPSGEVFLFLSLLFAGLYTRRSYSGSQSTRARRKVQAFLFRLDMDLLKRGTPTRRRTETSRARRKVLMRDGKYSREANLLGETTRGRENKSCKWSFYSGKSPF